MFVTINFASPTVAADSREQDVASKLGRTSYRNTPLIYYEFLLK